MTEAMAGVTPMMAQFLEIKAAYRDALLFYRMGDFYEMFFEDAEAAARALDIALTKRGKHLGEDIPMCGVPVHSAESYLLTLIRKGFRVAVCEQVEDPAEARKRGSKAVVKREVVRLVTPGTLTEDSLLEARRHNYLAAHAMAQGGGALAWVDISTGVVRVMPCAPERLGPELARLTPSEVLVSETQAEACAPEVEESGAALTPMARSSFESEGARARLLRVYGVATLDAFGRFERAEIAAMGALVAYLELTQKGNLPLLRPPVREEPKAHVQIDAATRRNLEISRSLSGGREGSLVGAIDRTATAAGARLLESRLASPARDLATINARLDAVGLLAENTGLRDGLRQALRRCPDIDRALSRLGLERGGPRDLAALRDGLVQAEAVAGLLGQAGALPALLEAAHGALGGLEGLRARLQAALVAEPPALLREGGVFAPGHDGELDDTRRLRDEGRTVIAGMQAGYAEDAGIPALKIKHNNVLGYFIEVTATHAARMLSAPLNEKFIHRQTTANAVRFTTTALTETETLILNAAGRAQEIERRLFEALRQAVLAEAAPLARLAAALAEIDLAAGLADLAAGEGWTRPVVDNSRAFAVRGGRHPVVEQALRRQGGAPFVANDCALCDTGATGAALWLLTGPNMGGKSTFLRQNALIALLAQAGSFVPAEAARIGRVSAIFSRVGASDDLARGRSTFMVEMVETAAILNQADDRALVILDEIGRGTATWDGLSIAWATLEHLHDVNRCRGLFATHYHELTSLAGRLDGVENATVAVREWQGDVIFLHEVQRGAADRSYGVQVARLAGLPAAVISRARAVLEALEAHAREGQAQGGSVSGAGAAAAVLDDLPLFSAAVPASQAPAASPSAVEEALAAIQPDDLSPREALELIYRLRALLDQTP